ncbi:hypothetical protein L915_12847 [Phytophthora nicotianae]|nr:hypothetical protein L915_12847 [Phytophthora nicotianae]
MPDPVRLFVSINANVVSPLAVDHNNDSMYRDFYLETNAL